MEGKAGDLVSKVDSDGLAVLDVLAVHVELDAALAQVVNGAVNVVGQDGDVAVGAAARLLHDLEFLLAHEDAAVADLDGHAQQVGDGLGSLGSLGLVSAVDADVAQLQTQHNVNGLTAHSGDLVPGTGLDLVALAHPGAADGDDLVVAQVVVDVLGVDAAGTELNDTNSKLWEEYQLTESEARSQCVPFESLTELRRSVTEVRGKIRALGNVNVGAIDEYKEVRERYDFMKAQVTDVEKAKAELTKMIAELCSEMQELFTASFKQINANFQQIFKELFGGGHARLYLSDEANVLESGIEIEVSPPGKVIKNLSALSGGEQALVAISIYFAILRVNPAPFCFLDEIEAALDDVNVARYAQYLRRMTDRTQFIVITHRRGTMEAADVLYGVTMQEDGVSKILRLDLDNVSADLIT